MERDARVQRMSAGELQEAFTALERTFHADPAPESRVAETGVVDTDRMLVVRDGDAVVATAGSFALTMTLPGGTVPVAGVTWVGVPADRRRQGLLAAMMRRLLTDLHRLVDVGGALEQRSYATDVDVVLDVADATCPWNAGRWRLSAGSAGAVCSRTQDAADLALDVRDLGAVLLGGTSLAARAAAGTVTARNEEVLARATTAFGWPGRAPWCPHVF